MPTAETLRALIAQVEEAKAGSRELDGQLTAAFDPPMDYAGELADIFTRMNDDDCGVFKSYHATPASYTQSVPPFTTSIDAALALVAKVLPATVRPALVQLPWGHWRCSLRCVEPGELPASYYDAVTLPLAILVALLRALLQQSETAHVER